MRQSMVSELDHERSSNSDEMGFTIAAARETIGLESNNLESELSHNHLQQQQTRDQQALTCRTIRQMLEESGQAPMLADWADQAQAHQQQQQQQQQNHHLEHQFQPHLYDPNHHLQQQTQQQQQQQQQQLSQAQLTSQTQQQSSQQPQTNNQQSSDTNNRPKRNPFCSRCRNHGKSAQVKGHKRHCEYRECQCEGCKLVECRQIVSAAQIKRRRYQKQDEECGRRIEVSPPVLSRTATSDPAALIAKTLGSASESPKASSTHPTSSTGCGGGGAGNGGGNRTTRPWLFGSGAGTTTPSTISSRQSPASRLAPIAAPPTPQSAMAAAANSFSQSSNPMQVLQYSNSPLFSAAWAAATGGSNAAAAAAAAAAAQASYPPATVAAAAAAANLLMTNPQAALMMASGRQYPAALMAAAASASGNCQAQVVAAAASPTMPQAAGAPMLPMPDLREQLNLVEEIHQNFGPLAVYAWLRDEQFNMGKVRQLIELARDPFDDLLQVNGHSPIDLTSPQVD